MPDTAAVRQDILDHYFEVERFDRDLGQIIQALERLGELDNTIVIIASDNGIYSRVRRPTCTTAERAFRSWFVGLASLKATV